MGQPTLFEIDRKRCGIDGLHTALGFFYSFLSPVGALMVSSINPLPPYKDIGIKDKFGG